MTLGHPTTATLWYGIVEVITDYGHWHDFKLNSPVQFHDNKPIVFSYYASTPHKGTHRTACTELHGIIGSNTYMRRVL
jgi:hypothetical protein